MFRVKGLKYRGILEIPEACIDFQKVTFITGESGAGKTTFLRLLNKMVSPDSGAIELFGQNIADIPSVLYRRRVLTAPQSPVIYPGSIRDNLIFGLQIVRGDLPDDALLKEMLTKFGLDKELDEPCTNLSGGEKQRISLIRLLLMDGEVFLLDEPTSALDSNSAAGVFAFAVQYLKERGKGLIAVSHDASLRERFGENFINLSKGGTAL